MGDQLRSRTPGAVGAILQAKSRNWGERARDWFDRKESMGKALLRGWTFRHASLGMILPLALISFLLVLRFNLLGRLVRFVRLFLQLHGNPESQNNPQLASRLYLEMLRVLKKSGIIARRNPDAQRICRVVKETKLSRRSARSFTQLYSAARFAALLARTPALRAKLRLFDHGGKFVGVWVSSRDNPAFFRTRSISDTTATQVADYSATPDCRATAGKAARSGQAAQQIETQHQKGRKSARAAISFQEMHGGTSIREAAPFPCFPCDRTNRAPSLPIARFRLQGLRQLHLVSEIVIDHPFVPGQLNPVRNQSKPRKHSRRYCGSRRRRIETTQPFPGK